MFHHKCTAALGVLLLAAPVWAADVTEYKGATLVRQEDRGVMVFKLKDKDMEVKATPTLSMKGFDKDGKELSNSIPPPKDEVYAKQVLKIGNVLDIKINQVNAKTVYLIEARLVEGELAKMGAPTQEKAPAKSAEEKAKDAEKKKAQVEEGRAKAAEQKEKLAASAKVYEKAKVRSYDEKKKTLTFQAEDKKLITVQIPGSVKVIDSEGTELKKDDRFSVFKSGNVLTITTNKPTTKEMVTEVKVEGKSSDKK